LAVAALKVLALMVETDRQVYLPLLLLHMAAAVAVKEALPVIIQPLLAAEVAKVILLMLAERAALKAILEVAAV
jgi:hypothetical protein